MAIISVALFSIFFLCLGDASKGEEAVDIRLPLSIIPEHYRIKMLPILEEGNLYGSVSLDFLVNKSTDRIVMHATNLTIDDNVSVVPLTRATRASSVEKLLDSEPVELESDPNEQANPYQVSYEKGKDFVIIQLPWTLTENRRYRVNLNYRGRLSDGLQGLYRTQYFDRKTNSKKWLAVTQMEPVDARRAFPCLDEPAMKATFEMIIGRSENMTSVSNMPLSRSYSMRNKDGWFWDYFERSIPMSTYLVAVLISDFDYRVARRLLRHTNSTAEGETSHTEIRVWAQKNMVNQMDLAIQVSPSMLEFLEFYFQVEFPLPKIDLVALPDFSAGAMENWGLITFREGSLLSDPAKSALRDDMYVEVTIAHELAHQWFGNLVTMEWWNDLWLNEGFATYVERLVMENVSPKYQYGTMQETQFLNAFVSDALDSSHPISVDVSQPDQINEIFDSISYTKGCAVIRMMSHFLGELTFRQALTNYLVQKKYRNAQQDDLWRFMTQQAHADGVLPPEVDVKSIMDTWTLQMGFPVITITRNYTDGSATFQQKRFFRTSGSYVAKNSLSKSEAATKGDGKREPDYLWWVPISYTDAGRKNFADGNTLPLLWLSPNRTSVTQDLDMDLDQWIIANIQGTGYFRVNYDAINWQMIGDQLLKDHQSIPVLNRARLISDSLALASIGAIPYSTAFNLIQYMNQEDHQVPWSSTLDALGYVGEMFEFTPHYGRYEAFLSSLVEAAYLRAVVRFKIEEDPISKFARVTLTRQACSRRVRFCTREAQSLYEEWMNSADPINYDGIDPDLRMNTYCTAIKLGGLREWDFAWQMASNVTSSQHRETILSALGCSREPWILIRFLSMTLNPESAIRNQDGMGVIEAVGWNSVGRSLAFQFLQSHFDELASRYTVVKTMETLQRVTDSFNTADELEMVENFLATKVDAWKSAQATYVEIVTTIAANVEWMERHSESLIQWFKSKNF